MLRRLALTLLVVTPLAGRAQASAPAGDDAARQALGAMLAGVDEAHTRAGVARGTRAWRASC